MFIEISFIYDKTSGPSVRDVLRYVVKTHLKVEPYSIHRSFLKLEYLKTKFNEDNGTNAIVKVISHSCRIMVNLSISDYFEVMRHP